jgi:hypothetical protein
MDERIKKNVRAGREERSLSDKMRSPAEDSLVSSQERRRTFRSEWQPEALPNPPEVPGFHLCWLSTTNQYDPIHKRMRLGYTPVKAEEIEGFDAYRVKSGELEGFVACNEMVLYKLPEDVYQEMMLEMHHYAPQDEQEKIRVQQEMLQEQARDAKGRPLVTIEGNGMNFDQTIKTPVFN